MLLHQGVPNQNASILQSNLWFSVGVHLLIVLRHCNTRCTCRTLSDCIPYMPEAGVGDWNHMT